MFQDVKDLILHRVPIKVLVENLKKIIKIENGKILEGALILIAKAAEGSVRDSLSLLDRAISLVRTFKVKRN